MSWGPYSRGNGGLDMVLDDRVNRSGQRTQRRGANARKRREQVSNARDNYTESIREERASLTRFVNTWNDPVFNELEGLSYSQGPSPDFNAPYRGSRSIYTYEQHLALNDRALRQQSSTYVF